MTDRSRVVLIAAPFAAQLPQQVQAISPDLRVAWPEPEGAAIPDDLWQQAEVLYTHAWTLPAPDRVPHLRWVQLTSAGANSLFEHPLFGQPVMFTTASGVHAVNIGEYVLTVTLAWFHRLAPLLEWQRRGEWPAEAHALFMPEELRGKTIGIVGYGSIGREVARLAQSFGMRVLAMQRGTDHRDHGFVFPGVGDPEGTIPDRYYPPDQLHAMLSVCDVVVIAVPLTPQTHGMFDAAAFQAMKPTAFLVNIARGDVCDEPALIRALEEQQIGGAALDVFHQEPLPAGHPLWRLPNVFISPHITGLTPQYNERLAMIFVANMRRYLAGESLYNLVDKARGY